jgi:hypothetical protein
MLSVFILTKFGYAELGYPELSNVGFGYSECLNTD